MPADLSHFSCEKRGGEQRCGCAMLVPKAREKQWWKFTALSFQAGNTAGVNSNPWWWNRSVHSSSGADFHGKVVVFLLIHIYSMATKKQGHNCTDSATNPWAALMQDLFLRPPVSLPFSVPSWACSPLPDFFWGFTDDSKSRDSLSSYSFFHTTIFWPV